MSSTRPEGGVVVGEVRLRLVVPEGGREEPGERLPSVDLSAIAGARVALRRGVEGEGGLGLRALCVVAPSDRWVPGVEELVLDRASALARSGVPGRIERWEAGAIRWTGELFEQRLEGMGRGAEGELAVQGRQVLGFTGEEREAVLCAVLCMERAVGGASGGRCGELIDAVALEGTLVPPPPPSLMARGALVVAEHPVETGVVLGVIAAIGIGVLLARRPRWASWR